MPDWTRPDNRPDPVHPGPNVDRTTIADAAARLGISTDAVRKRLARGQLAGEKVGEVWVVFLPRDEVSGDTSISDRTASSPGPDSDRTATGSDRTMSTPVYNLIAAKDETIARLDAEVSFLRRELETRTDELQRRDVLLREALQRVPHLTATSGGATGETTTGNAAATKAEDPPQPINIRLSRRLGQWYAHLPLRRRRRVAIACWLGVVVPLVAFLVGYIYLVSTR